jgi:hypothetical protein
MSDPRLPDFLIIGAPKSGTTSLYYYLQQHPQVWMPTVKEPHWFLFDGPEPPPLGGPRDAIREREMIRSWSGYQALFAPCPPDRICGEASVRYLYSPQACAAIHERLPGVRLIVILRHPVDRAYSAYRRDRVHGAEGCATFAEAIADGPRREREGWLTGIYQALGCYGRALRPWMETFDPGQIRIYLYDDLVADAAAVIRDLYRFIGVDDGFRPDLSQRFNVTGRIRNPVWRWLWNGTRGLRSHVVAHAPLALRGHLFKIAAGLPRDKDQPEPLDAALHLQLIDAYRDDIRALAELLGRNLDAWLETEPRGADQRTVQTPGRPSTSPG